MAVGATGGGATEGPGGAGATGVETLFVAGIASDDSFA